MSSVLKKLLADKMVFKHNPKAFRIETSAVADDFVHLQNKKGSDFQIADVVAQHSGVEALRKKNIETQVENTVLDRLKEIEEQAYKQAYDLGMIEGSQKAFEEKHKYFEEKLIALDSLYQTLEVVKANILKENEVIFMRLIFQIAGKIAMREISLQQEPIVEMMTALVTEVQAADSINIQLSPEDTKFIEELREKKVKSVEPLSRVKLHSNPDVKMGGCIIETNFGAIDGSVAQRVEKAWALIESKLPTIKKDTAANGNSP